MTVAWLSLAAAVLVLGAHDEARARAGVLARAGRLIAPPTMSRRSSRQFARPGVGVVTGSAVAVTWLTGGPALAIAAGAVAGTGWLVVHDAARRRRVRARRAQLRSAVQLVVGELEVGSRPAAALAAAVDAGPAYAAMFADAARVAERGDAARVLARDRGTQPLAVAWRMSEDAGLELAAVLSRVALDLAVEEDHWRAVGVALAGARASATLLALLPVLGLALGVAMGARPWNFLLGSGTGSAVCCLGTLLDVAGVLWMRRILHGAQRT